MTAWSTVPDMVAWGDVPTWLAVGVGAVGGGAALRQLGLQRTQLRDQQKVIAEQSRLLERQQADRIEVEPGALFGPAAKVLPDEENELVHMVKVSNGSARPIRNLTAKIEVRQVNGNSDQTRFPNTIGQMWPLPIGSNVTDQVFVFKEHAEQMRVLRAGHTAALVFSFRCDRYYQPQFITRFDDDAGLHWQIDNDLHLEKLDSRDW